MFRHMLQKVQQRIPFQITNRACQRCACPASPSPPSPTLGRKGNTAFQCRAEPLSPQGERGWVREKNGTACYLKGFGVRRHQRRSDGAWGAAPKTLRKP